MAYISEVKDYVVIIATVSVSEVLIFACARITRVA